MKNLWKRLSGILLAAVMVLAFNVVPAQAKMIGSTPAEGDTGTVTINGLQTGDSVTSPRS